MGLLNLIWNLLDFRTKKTAKDIGTKYNNKKCNSSRKCNNPNIYILSRVSKFTKQSLTELKKSKIIIGDFSSHLIVIGKISRHKISKGIELNTISQLAQMNINRRLYPTIAEYSFFLSLNGTFTKIDHIKHTLTN